MATKLHEVDVEIDDDIETGDAMTLEDDEPAEEEPAEPTTTKPAAPTDAELLACIHEAHAVATAAKHRWMAAKEDAKAAKEEYDMAVDLMMRAISQKDEDYPLFESPAVKTSTTIKPDAWRTASIEELDDLKASLLDLLQDNSIKTIGDLEDVRAGTGLHSISGIGPAKVTQIEDSVLRWLDTNRDEWGVPVDEEEVETEKG